MAVIERPPLPAPALVGPNGPTAVEGVKRWVVYDDRGNGYTFRVNPDAMTSPFSERNITARRTTHPRGNWMLYEGERTPVQWTFSGNIMTKGEYLAMWKWFFTKNRRLWIIDHYGRRLAIVTQSFKPVPKRSIGKYWRHTYEVNALVLGVKHSA